MRPAPQLHLIVDNYATHKHSGEALAGSSPSLPRPLHPFATNEDIKLDGQMKLSALRYDPGLSELLAPSCEAASRERESLRQQIKKHDATHHSSSPWIK
jgi:hypothetical protein